MNDFDACVAMDRDTEVIRFVGPPWSNDEEHLAFLHHRIATAYPEGMGYWSVFLQDAPTDFLGWIMLCPTSVGDGGVEIGWRLKRNAWGRGIATEAATPILRRGFATATLEQVVADIHPDNHGSIRVAEKLGLGFTGMVDYGGEAARRYSIGRAAFEALQEAPPNHPNSRNST